MKKTHRLKYLKQALLDMQEIIEYIVTKFSAPQSAVNLLEKLENKIANLQCFPLAGKEFIASNVLQDEYRVLIVENYLVFYVVIIFFKCETVKYSVA